MRLQAAVAIGIILSVTAANAHSGPDAGSMIPNSPQTGWKTIAGHMTNGRWAPGACILPRDNSAVISGGYDYAIHSCVATIDLFDEQTGSFRRSRARMTYPRDFLAANPLPDGTVLLSGGFNDIWASLDIAEIYDPVADTCRLARGRMNQHRELFQGTNLVDGTVLMTGGLDLWARGTVSTAEIYHPETEQFTPTRGNLAQDRFGHTACLLADGRVLIVGGTHWDMVKKQTRVLDSAEIYDPSTESFHLTAGHLLTARDRPTATLLPTGKVLIFGGQGPAGAAVTTAELFDPATEQFTVIPSAPLEPRMAHNAVLVPTTGQVLISGGWNAAIKATTPTDLLFDPATSQFTPLPDLPFASHDDALIVFADGEVLCAGGKSVSKGKSSSVDEGAVLVL